MTVYEVLQIVRAKGSGSKRRYLVEWVGFPLAKDRTWEPRGNFLGQEANRILADFDKAPQKPKAVFSPLFENTPRCPEDIQVLVFSFGCRRKLPQVNRYLRKLFQAHKTALPGHFRHEHSMSARALKKLIPRLPNIRRLWTDDSTFLGNVVFPKMASRVRGLQTLEAPVDNAQLQRIVTAFPNLREFSDKPMSRWAPTGDVDISLLRGLSQLTKLKLKPIVPLRLEPGSFARLVSLQLRVSHAHPSLRVLVDAFPNLERLELTTPSHFADAREVPLLAKLPRLARLQLRIPDNCVLPPASFMRLASLTVIYRGLFDTRVWAQAAPNLETLELVCVSLNAALDPVLAPLCDLPRLARLKVTCRQEIPALPCSLARLVNLDLNCWGGIQQAHELFAAAPNLKIAQFDCVPTFELDELLPFLPDGIRELTASQGRLQESDANLLSRFTQLGTLGVTLGPSDDAALSALTALPVLKHLRLTGSFWSALSSLVNLESLEVAGGGFRPQHLRFLTSLTKLQRLKTQFTLPENSNGQAAIAKYLHKHKSWKSPSPSADFCKKCLVSRQTTYHLPFLVCGGCQQGMHPVCAGVADWENHLQHWFCDDKCKVVWEKRKAAELRAQQVAKQRQDLRRVAEEERKRKRKVQREQTAKDREECNKAREERSNAREKKHKQS